MSLLVQNIMHLFFILLGVGFINFVQQKLFKLNLDKPK